MAVGSFSDFLKAAWAEYKRNNPGANQNQWYQDNVGNLQSYYNTLAAQQISTPAPPAYGGINAEQGAALETAIQQIMSRYGMTHEQARQALMNPDIIKTGVNPATGMPWNVQYDTGLEKQKVEDARRAEEERIRVERERIAEQRRQEEARLAFESGVATGKVGGVNTLDSVKYSNSILSDPQNAALGEQVRKGFALGDIPGQTVASYLNRSVDKPVGTIASPVPKPVPGARFGDELDIKPTSPNADAQYAKYDAKAQSQAPKPLGGLVEEMQKFVAAGGTAEDFVSRILKVAELAKQHQYDWLEGGGTRWENRPNEAPARSYDESLTRIKSRIANEQPDWARMPGAVPNAVRAEEPPIETPVMGGSGDTAYSNMYDESNGFVYRGINGKFYLSSEIARREGNRDFAVDAGGKILDVAAIATNPVGAVVDKYGSPGNVKKSIGWLAEHANTGGYAGGGQVTVEGQPHWIVDNNGVPQAALSEDGKAETIKGKGGVEVIPLDPQRRAAYEAKKAAMGDRPPTPGMAMGDTWNLSNPSNSGRNGRRTAPSRRPGSTAGNSSKNISGSRVDLPDGTVSSVKRGVGGSDGRSTNGQNQGYQTSDTLQDLLKGASKRGVGDTTDVRKPVDTNVNDMAAKVQARIEKNGPQPVKVTPGASYMAGIRPRPSIQPRPGAVATPVSGPVMSGPTSLPVTVDQIAAHYASTPGMANYDATYDLNSDGKVNSVDQLLAIKRQQPIVRNPILDVGFDGGVPVGPGFENTTPIYRAPNIVPEAPHTALPGPTAGYPPKTVTPKFEGGTVEIPGAAYGDMFTPAPTFISSGGPRTIGNAVAAPRFGFASNAPTAIAGQNQRMGVKNQPGVFVNAAWKWSPRVLKTMSTPDRQALESYIRATGSNVAGFYDSAKYAEPTTPSEYRTFN